MLYTTNGDDGKTGLFGCDQRISKSSAIAEALGCLDEINSLLGWCKVKAGDKSFKVGTVGIAAMIDEVQQDLFIIQAQLAGAPKVLPVERIKVMESLIGEIEKILPPIKTFFVAGGTELAAIFDHARTVARRAERRVIAAHEEGLVKISQESLALLNRLSSLLYALARLANHDSGVNEEAPRY
ncbi:MAG: cob(I)yrinic acid a,c-diamide adenosyltransferase [Candidatus Paceibacterota bacterium]|jgi:cob(I)alamin adenosyltransferase